MSLQDRFLNVANHTSLQKVMAVADSHRLPEFPDEARMSKKNHEQIMALLDAAVQPDESLRKKVESLGLIRTATKFVELLSQKAPPLSVDKILLCALLDFKKWADLSAPQPQYTLTSRDPGSPVLFTYTRRDGSQTPITTYSFLCSVLEVLDKHPDMAPNVRLQLISALSDLEGAKPKPPTAPKPKSPTPPEPAAATAMEVSTNVPSDITAYLATPCMPKAVLKLARLGEERYAKGEVLLSEPRATRKARGGGRSGDWIQATFGKSEVTIGDTFAQLPPPPTWTVADIKAAAAQVKPKSPSHNHPLTIVQGVSVNYLQDSKYGKNAILQLASQFNFLEAVSPARMPVHKYLHDSTQGPQGSIEAAAAALYRDATNQTGALTYALVNVLPLHHEAYYRNGYLELSSLSPDQQSKLYDYIRDHLDTLRILPQWVICEASGTIQLQVFSAAPSYQGEAPPALGSWGAKITELLVVEEYEAIARLAVIRSKFVPQTYVHLTLVGQGAFNNPESVLGAALHAYAKIVRSHPSIRTFIHGYAQDSVERILRQAGDLCNKTIMTKDQFFQ